MSVHTFLRKNEMHAFIGFRPHSMGVTVEANGLTYRPEYRLQSELQQRTDSPGAPEYWATDGNRVSFDKPAAADYLITCEK